MNLAFATTYAHMTNNIDQTINYHVCGSDLLSSQTHDFDVFGCYTYFYTNLTRAPQAHYYSLIALLRRLQVEYRHEAEVVREPPGLFTRKPSLLALPTLLL